MPYPVKYFDSTHATSPVLGATRGDLVALLDAVLVTGYAIKTVDSITRAGSVATAIVSAGHSYTVGQVLRNEGCLEAEYNGEIQVLGRTATSYTFTVTGTPATPATTATTITTKVAPLGFVKEFSGTNKAVYRSPNVLSNRPYLRVDDSQDPVWTATYAKYGKVTMAQGMTNVDTFVGARAPYDPAFPTRNEVGSGSGASALDGVCKWYYARNGAGDTGVPSAGGRDWILIGDDRGFYLYTAHDNTGARAGYAFGDFASLKAGDSFNSILAGVENYAQASVSSIQFPNRKSNSPTEHTYEGRYLMRNYTQLGGVTRAAYLSLSGGPTATISGYNSNFPFPNGADYSLVATPVLLKEEGGSLRGTMPGLFHLQHNQPYPDRTVLDNVAGYAGRKFLIVGSAYESSGNVCSQLFDITGPWR